MYQEKYKQKLIKPEDACQYLSNGNTIVYGMSVTEPPALLRALANHILENKLEKIKAFSFLPLEHSFKTIRNPKLADQVEAFSWFVSSATRGLVRTGLNYYVPCYLHQIPKLCTDYMKIDLVITTVSPMDKAGFFSFGTGNDYISTAARHCQKVIVEVNENMPRVFGGSLIHISEVDAIVENNEPLLELPKIIPKPEDAIIGKLVAEEIPDAAVIQLGIGGLPNAVANFLKDHKDLGIHTELLTTGMIELIKNGAITGKRKNMHPYKHIFTTASGNKEMYEFMDNNSGMESYPATYVCSPAVIAQNKNMIAVNSIIEIDLLGQCNAEYLAESTFSGTGGQLDFVRGAFDSEGGKSIQLCYATTKNVTISKIVPRLKEGVVITSPRADTQYVATEYGIINLKGKSTRERALDIISIAHPKFRDELLKEAEKMYLI